MAVRKRKAKLLLNLEASGTSYNTLSQIMEYMLSNMIGHINGEVQSFIMLTGDVGIGKTSILKQIAKAMGMDMLILEAPSISEEDLIEIPYIVIKSGTKGEKEGVITTDVKANSDIQVDITYVENKMVQLLKKLKGIPVEKIPNKLSKKYEKKLYEEYKDMIELVREKYDVMFFIDEYYRTGNLKVKNILRNLLNGKIGNRKLPENTYVVFATNVMEKTSGALDEVPMNQEFDNIDLDSMVTNDTFIDYAKDAFEAELSEVINKSIKGSIDTVLNPEDVEKLDIPNVKKKYVINVAKTLEATDKTLKMMQANNIDIFKRDLEMEYEEEAPSRISPRRLEYITRFVANTLPNDKEELEKLAYYLVNTLRDYKTLKISSKISSFIAVYLKNIAEENNLNVSDDEIKEMIEKAYKDKYFDKSEEILETKLKVALKGEKTLPTVLSSRPGTGKTTKLINLTKKLGYGEPITIDGSTLNADDVKEINILKPNGEIDNKPAPLYTMIMREYEERKKRGFKKVILFIDEFNRASSTKVYNGLRQLLLDKKIATRKLPDDIIIVGALNPNDKGTKELTYHTQDVLDVIPFNVKPEDVTKYTVESNIADKIEEQKGIKIKEFMKLFLKQFFDGLDDYSIDGTPYNLDIDGIEAYISPRMITSWIRQSYTMIYMKLLKMSDSDIDEVIVKKYINDILLMQFKSKINDMAVRLKLDNDEKDELSKFFNRLIEKIVSSLSIEIEKNIVVEISGLMKDLNSIEEIKDFLESGELDNVAIKKNSDKEIITNAFLEMISNAEFYSIDYLKKLGDDYADKLQTFNDLYIETMRIMRNEIINLISKLNDKEYAETLKSKFNYMIINIIDYIENNFK